MDTIRHVAALPVIDGRDRERADRLSYIAMSSFVLEAEFAAVRREAEVEMKHAVEEAVKAERAKVVADLRTRARGCAIMRSMKMTEQARTLESLALCIERGEHL